VVLVFLEIATKKWVLIILPYVLPQKIGANQEANLCVELFLVFCAKFDIKDFLFFADFHFFLHFHFHFHFFFFSSFIFIFLCIFAPPRSPTKNLQKNIFFFKKRKAMEKKGQVNIFLLFFILFYLYLN